jgi:UDP-N-acetylmuramoyl-L-alanyl-D-glutamate--2,6-diaminopimelate ligase
MPAGFGASVFGKEADLMHPLSQASPALSLRKLLPQGLIIGPPDVSVRSCCGRWSECEPDDVYVALVDGSGDGHDHIDDAIAKGASAVVSERRLAIDRPQCVVEDSRIAYGKICHALAGDPCAKLTTIGITGSMGKTTTGHLIHGILNQDGGTSGLFTSLEHPAESLVDQQLDLQPPALAGWLSEQFMAGRRFGILEAPSTALAQQRLAGLDLDVAVLTNVRREHLDLHGGTDNYRAAKLRLFDHLKPTGLAIVNADDPTSSDLLDQLDCPALTIGVRQAAEISGRIIEKSAGEQILLIRAGNQVAPVRTPLSGEFQIYNVLSACAVGLALGLELPSIARGLQSVPPLAGRLEPVICGQSFGVWIDISQTNCQLAAALHTLRSITNGRMICVATTTPGQTEQQRAQLGRLVERGADRCILTANRLGQAIDYEPYHQVLDGFQHTHRGHVIPDRLAAIEYALSVAQPGDAVLISGCGDQPIATMGDGQWQIIDRDICQAWLYERELDLPGKPDPKAPTTYWIDDYRS